MRTDRLPLLTIHNQHIAPCTVDFAPDTAAFLSYFEGPTGDQWVLRYQNGADHAMLWGGALMWRGIPISIGNSYTHNLRLLPSEQHWMSACMVLISRMAACPAEHVTCSSA
jgi:hypothetical protein